MTNPTPDYTEEVSQIVSIVGPIKTLLQSSVSLEKKSQFSFTAGQLASLYYELTARLNSFSDDLEIQYLARTIAATANRLQEGTPVAVGYAYGQWNFLADELEKTLGAYIND